jgi:hypothetical protein
MTHALLEIALTRKDDLLINMVAIEIYSPLRCSLGHEDNNSIFNINWHFELGGHTEDIGESFHNNVMAWLKT